VAIVQSNYVIVANTSPAIVALPGSATPGNVILLAIAWYGEATLPVPADANGTYSSIVNPGSNNTNNATSLFYVANCAAGTHSSTINSVAGNPDGNFFATAAIYEVSGLLSAPLDKSNDATTTGSGGWTSQPTGSTGTLAQANEWVFVACGFDDNPGVTNEGVMVPSGFTVDPNIPSSFQDTIPNVCLQIGWMTVSSTAALNPSFTWASQPTISSTYAVIATFER
jgi:hypothetical protein